MSPARWAVASLALTPFALAWACTATPGPTPGASLDAPAESTVCLAERCAVPQRWAATALPNDLIARPMTPSRSVFIRTRHVWRPDSPHVGGHESTEEHAHCLRAVCASGQLAEPIYCPADKGRLAQPPRAVTYRFTCRPVAAGAFWLRVDEGHPRSLALHVDGMPIAQLRASPKALGPVHHLVPIRFVPESSVRVTVAEAADATKPLGAAHLVLPSSASVVRLSLEASAAPRRRHRQRPVRIR